MVVLPEIIENLFGRIYTFSSYKTYQQELTIVDNENEYSFIYSPKNHADGFEIHLNKKQSTITTIIGGNADEGKCLFFKDKDIETSGNIIMDKYTLLKVIGDFASNEDSKVLKAIVVGGLKVKDLAFATYDYPERDDLIYTTNLLNFVIGSEKEEK